MTINDPDWLTPFSLCTGIALVCGYALLGATWMIIKSTGRLQRKMVHYARGLLVLVSFFCFSLVFGRLCIVRKCFIVGIAFQMCYY